MEDVIEIKPLNDSNSVCRELVMIKVRANASERAELISLADILSHAVIYPEYMAELLDKDHSFEDIEQAYEKTAAIQEVLRTVDSLYDREIFSEDLAYEKKKLQIAGNGDGRLARMQRSGVLRMLRKYAKDPEQVTAENLPEQLEQLMALQEQYHDVGKLSALET